VTRLEAAREHAQSVGLDPGKLPRHIAIIMDGNGRWAAAQGKPRAEGHAQGAHSVDVVVEECCRIGIGQLTLYCLSSENWKRPKDELDFLMALLKEYLLAEREKILRQNIRFTVIGRREGFPSDVLAEIDESMRLSAKNTGLTLCLAINYGSRQEILDAIRSVILQVKRGDMPMDSIDEETISNNLYTAGMPDPDLLIRTAGEMRISNYLLWQISYAEIYVTPICWPAFGVPELHAALRDFAARDRRFGGLENLRGAAE
jgi:undecaprenyl diphosphate synthase